MAIINNRQEQEETSAFKRVQVKAKEWTYILIHELSEAQIITANLYKLLVLIETCQFLWYVLNPKYTFLWDIQIFDWIKTALKYFQFDGIASGDNGSIFLTLLYITFGLTLISMIATIYITVVFVKRIGKIKRTNSSILNHIIKALSGYSILLITILSFPFYFIFMATFICHKDNQIHGTIECYKGTYFVHIVVAIIGMIFLFVTSFTFGILSMDLNPWSKMPYAAPGSRINILKLVFKIGVVLYANLDYTGDGAEGFLVVFGIFWLLVLMLRYRQTPCYNKSVFYFILGNEVTIFWTAVVSIFHAFIDDYPSDNMGLFFLVIGIPPLIFGYLIIINNRASSFRKLHIKDFKRDVDFEMYLLNIISLIENRNDPDKRMSLEGLLKFHIKKCNRSDEECPCYPLARDYLKDDQDAPEKLWYSWIRIIMKEAIEKFQKSARLHVLYAYIEREKLDNKFKALYELMQAQIQKLSLEEEFSVYRYKMIIENEMIENDARATELKGGVDVNLIVEFQKKFIIFQEAIEASVEFHLAFWKELLEANPDLQKLQSLGSRITSSVEETSEQFKKLSNLNSNQRKMLEIYGNFLKDIVNDEIESQIILEKVDYVDRNQALNRQFMDSDKLKYGENSNTCLVTLSCNYNNMGIVTTINNEITRILDYPKEEILGRNISRIMPKVIAELHDIFLNNYFSTSQGKIIGIERLVFPINKMGYLVPCTLMIKVLPNLDEGIRLVGFMKEVEKETDPNRHIQDPEKDNEKDDLDTKENYIMYDGNTGIIYGITYGMKEDFGVPISLIHNATNGAIDFTLESIFPNLANHDVDELKNSEGVTTQIDTKNLKENYLVAQNVNEDDTFDIDPELKEKRYRSIQVKAQLIQNDVYEGVNVRILRISEILELGEDKSPAKELQKKQAIENEIQRSNLEFNATANKRLYEKGESVSVGSEDSSAIDNEEIRLIKDYKILISAKTTPKSILILRNVIGLISIALIVMISVILSMRLSQNSEFKDNIEALSDVSQRNVLLAEATYRMRNLDLLARNLLDVPSGQTNSEFVQELKDLASNLFSTLRIVNLNIGNLQSSLSSSDSSNAESVTIPIETIVQTGPKTETKIFSDAMSQYMAHGTSAIIAPIASFTSTDPKVTVPGGFFYVRRNGYGALRYQSELNTNAYYSYCYDRTNKLNIKFEIIMIAVIILLVIVEAILIPIVFSVHRTATRVLSLFGYIPLSEIRLMAERCDNYMVNFLEEHKRLAKMSFADEDQADQLRVSKQMYAEVSQNANIDALSPEGEDLDVSNKLETSMDMLSAKNRFDTSPVNQLASNRYENPNSVNVNIKTPRLERKQTSEHHRMNTDMAERIMITEVNTPINKNPDMKEKIREMMEHEEEPEVQYDRSQKLMNSKENIRAKVIVQFVVVGLLYIGYFVGDYLHNNSVLKDVKNGFNYLKINSGIETSFRFLNGFTLEEIVEVNPATIYQYTYSDWIDLRAFYKRQTLENLQLVSSGRTQGFPGAFNSYLDRFHVLSNGNLCQEFYNQDAQTIAECNAVSSGVLNQGFVIAITRVIQNTDDMLRNFNGTLKDVPAKSGIINDDFAETSEIVEKVTPILQDLKREYMNSFSDYLNTSKTLEIIKFVIFLSLGFCSFIFLWMPYRKNLNSKIYKTKGMLKMIPMDIISKDDNLKSLFLSGNILQAAK